MDVTVVVTNRRTRVGFLLLALLVYAGLVGYGSFAGSPAAFALADVHVGAVLLVGVGFAVAVREQRADLLNLAAAGYLFAGLAIGYGGLSSLGVVPSSPLLDPVGDVALVIALAAYLYQREVADDGDLTAESASE